MSTRLTRGPGLLPAILPALALGGAALMLAPAPELQAFSKLGGSLGTNQRDVRLYDNFTDATANDNNVSSPQFPGFVGAELAIWKGVVEWGSGPHGDGTGDPQQAVLGNGGANFDALFAGNASSVGTSNHNVVSEISSCSSGVLAYTETPISDGWRIRFCRSWTWDDGPGTIGSRWDIQGIMAHEYGHALGLGHSGVSGTTMWPSVGAGSTSIRSIEADDIAGVKCIYGVKSASKPNIIATVGNGTTLTIHGSNFSATGNEVWFRKGVVTTPSGDPRVKVTNVSSNGLLITVAIPAGAAAGDVMVKTNATGHASLSNAFPTDLTGTFGNPPIVVQPVLDSVAPASIEVLLPGTARTVALQGAQLDRTAELLLDGVPVERSRWEAVEDATILLDMPQAELGVHELAVSDGLSASSAGIEVVVPLGPRLELGDGDPQGVVYRDEGLRLRYAGRPGSAQVLLVSRDGRPSQNALVSLELGNGFTSLVRAGTYTIPARGWLELSVAGLPDPGPGGTLWYAQSVELPSAPGGRLAASNLQSIFLKR
jgi:hypothetical protein